MSSVNMSSGAIVEGWMRAMGLDPKPISASDVNWGFEVQVPVGGPLKMGVFNSKARPRAVDIVSRTVVAPVHREAFNGLDPDTRREFVARLNQSLNREFSEYILEPVKDSDCPAAFTAVATRYDDGVTLDSFARSVSSVHKATRDANLLFVEYFGTPGEPMSGEFDFIPLRRQ